MEEKPGLLLMGISIKMLDPLCIKGADPANKGMNFVPFI
jgi:hypothetical protein